MSPYVLILVLKFGLGATAVTVDFPNEKSCKAAMKEANQVSAVQMAWCLNRQPNHPGDQ